MSEPVFPYAYLAAEKVARIFDGRSVSPVIPKIYSDQDAPNIKRKENTLQKISVSASNYVYKLILGGDGAVGKTSMVQRFVEGIFRTDYKATIGTSITKKECKFDGLDSNVRFTIWDLADQSQFERIRSSYLVNAEAGMLVYDITRRDTYNNIKKWYNEVQKGAKPNIILILCGNKTDLRDTRIVSIEEGEKLAEELGISYIETSALTGENINDAFRMIALQLIKRFLKADEISKIEEYSSIATENAKEEAILMKEPDLGDYIVIPVNEIWPDIKRDFNPWLERNLEHINKALDLSLIPIEKDNIIENLTIDVLAQDRFGNKVIIETQNGESAQKNLIKILKSLAYYNVKKVIWICENPKDEHKRIINWLNDNSLEDIAFYLVKIEVFRIDNSPPTPLFIKICSPNKKFKNLYIHEQLSFIEKKRIEFWEKLIDKIYLNYTEHANITPLKTSWIAVEAGKEGLSYKYIIKNDWAVIQLYFDHPDRNINNKRFKALESKKENLNKEFFELSWQTSDNLDWEFEEGRNFQAISYRFENGGLNYKDTWADLQAKMVDTMKYLVKIFQKHISSLNV